MTLQRGLPTLCLLVPILMSAWTGPASAGDYASRNIIGFSPDGGTFAFEQHGVQDGSGFPYSDIFVIDTAADKWVAGSPFRVLVHDEQVPLEEARRQAMAKAAKLLRQRRVEQPGRRLASNTPFELSADPHRVEVNVSPVPTMPPQPWAFALEVYPVEENSCAAFTDDDIKGFRLTVRPQGQQEKVLYEDDAIPKSRGCPLRYAISDIVTHYRGGQERVFAVLVSVFQLGFEGPDRRFLAVTAKIP